MPVKRTSGKAKTKDVFGHLHKAPKMLRAALYARVSTLDQQTLPMQMRAMRDYAANRGWTVAMQVKEVGSGAVRREQRQQLIDAARRREIDVVLVWRLDRWGRSLLDLVTTLQELIDLNIGFVSLTEALDLTTSTGRAMAGMLSVFAAFEHDILRERVRAGLDHARQSGTRLGRPPTAAIKAAEVRKLFRQGISKSEISRRLDIGRTSVRRILAQKKSNSAALRTLTENSQCSYFDYQRDKVYVRTHPHLNAPKPRRRRAKVRINAVSSVESDRCPLCRSKQIEQRRRMSRVDIDLKFFRGGVKKWITQTLSWRYQCRKCNHRFSSDQSSVKHQRYGHGLVSWCVYSNVACGVNMLQTKESVADVFGLELPNCQAYRWKGYVSAFYKPLYSEILQSLLSGPVIHIDETTVRLRKQNGYVWVMTSVDRAYYFYKPSREGSFLADLLSPFAGVLVSDFYTAYDSLHLAHQKCLLHLVRDIDEDVMKNPLDTELRKIALEFGSLIRAIIETVDRRGLRSRFLAKHKRPADHFLKRLSVTTFISPLANKYKSRFQKNSGKLFTFLEHDAVPWNNNSAEHAIKRFAPPPPPPPPPSTAVTRTDDLRNARWLNT